MPRKTKAKDVVLPEIPDGFNTQEFLDTFKRVADGVVRSMREERVMDFSASRIDYFFRCSGAWKLKYLDGIEEETGEPARVGKMVHEMIEAVLKKEPFDYKGEGEVFQEAMSIFNRWERDFLPNINPENLLAVEEEFKIKIGEHTLIGFMDRLEDVGGFLTITDIKTSRNLLTKQQMKESWQVRAYCVAAMKMHPHYRDVVFRIENPRLGEHQVIEVEKAEVDRWEDDLSVAMSLIKTRVTVHERGEKGAFPYSPGAACQWCGMFKHCGEVKKAEAARKSQVRTITSARTAVERIALLERKLKDLKATLKEFVEEKGSVTRGGLVWGLWPSRARKVDEAMIPEGERSRFDVFRCVNDAADSPLWDDARLVADLKSWNAVKETTSMRFSAKKVKEGEDGE